jgi:hypothetical protein
MTVMAAPDLSGEAAAAAAATIVARLAVSINLAATHPACQLLNAFALLLLLQVSAHMQPGCGADVHHVMEAGHTHSTLLPLLLPLLLLLLPHLLLLLLLPHLLLLLLLPPGLCSHAAWAR